MVERGNFVGICGFSSLDWATCDLASTYRCPWDRTGPLPKTMQKYSCW